MAINWFHRFLHPHCPDCREEREDSKVCRSCETLKEQIESIRSENKRLLDRLLEKPAPEPEQKSVEITRPINIPWNVRKQMLEAEDRERAKLLRNAPKPIPTEDLEKDLEIAATQRETQTG